MIINQRKGSEKVDFFVTILVNALELITDKSLDPRIRVQAISATCTLIKTLDEFLKEKNSD